MKTHTVAITAFIAAALAVAAILVTSRSTPTAAPAEGAGQAVLPALAAKLNDAAEIQIQRAGQTSTFRRTSEGGRWTIAEKDNYPAKSENIRTLLIGLAELKTVEAKTSKPELYSKIGVQDPGSAAAPADDPTAPDAQPPTQPSLITIKDAAGASLGSVIIGTQKWGTTPEVYLRRPGEAQSWLATGKVDVPWDALAWVDRQILNIPRDKWKSVTITHSDGETITVTKSEASQANFFIEEIPDGRQTTSPTAGDSLGTVFTSLTLDDVKQSAAFTPEQLAAAPRTVGTTFDGLTITARTLELDGKKWAILEAAAANPDEQPDTTKQANELNAKLTGWAFAIPDFKSKSLLTRWSDLLKPVEQPSVPAESTTQPTNDVPVTPAQDPAPRIPPAPSAPPR